MSGSHILLLAVVVIIFVLGPAKLPQLGRSMGDAIRGFKKGISGEEDGEIDVTNSTREKLHGTPANEAQVQKKREKSEV